MFPFEIKFVLSASKIITAKIAPATLTSKLNKKAVLFLDINEYKMIYDAKLHNCNGIRLHVNSPSDENS